MNEFFFITFHKNIFSNLYVIKYIILSLSDQMHFSFIFIENIMHLSFMHIPVEASMNSIKIRKLYQKILMC